MRKYQPVSTTLIQQLEISARKEAGLPSFNPSDHPPLPPSILQDAISAVGSNGDAAAALRCTDCRGELLRGSHSIICIYCGRFQNNSHDSPPISFKSTLGYHWFLRSLSLDGSENVERLIDRVSESSKGQSSVKDEIPLSEFLDLQLKRSDELNRIGLENEHANKLSKLVGVDFDALLRTEESLEQASTSSNKQVVLNENPKTEDLTFPAQSSLSLFKNETKSGEVENDEEADWAAEFQSADTDFKVGHGSVQNLTHESLEKSNLGNVSILTSDGERQSQESVVAYQSERSSRLTEDKGKFFASADDASFDWLPAADKQAISEKGDPPPELRDDDWDEFRMFTGTDNNQSEPNSTSLHGVESSGEVDVTDSWDDFTGAVGSGHNQLLDDLGVLKPAHSGDSNFDLQDYTVTEKPDVYVESSHNVTSNQADSLGLWSDTSKEVDDSYDLWNDFKSSAVKHDNQQQSTATETYGHERTVEGDDLFKGQHDFDGFNVVNKDQRPCSSEGNPKISETPGDSALWNNDTFDVWSDFTRSNGASDNKSVNNDPLSGAWNDVSSLIGTHMNQPKSSHVASVENKEVTKDNSGFGSWSDFTTSQAQPETNFSGIDLIALSSDKISTESLTSVVDNNMHDSWGDFGWSTSISQQQSHAGGTKPIENKLNTEDLFGVNSDNKDSINLADNQFDGATFNDGKLASGNDGAIDDAWSDFTSSSNVQAGSWLRSNGNAASSQHEVNHDPLDVWNIIGNKSSGEDTTTEKVDIPEFNLLDTGKPQFAGTNSSLQGDPFQGILIDNNDSVQVAISHTEAPNLDRAEADVKADGSYQFNRSEMVTEGASDLKSPVAETLISEMHDLSFMLENSLSIPKSST